MKKLLLLLVAFCAIFASCDKDDKFEGNASAFVGTTWEAIDEYDDEYEEGVTVKCKDIYTAKFEKNSKVKLGTKYYENGTLVEEYSEDGTYSVDDDVITIKMVDEGKEYNMTGEIDGKTFTMRYDGATLVFKKK